MNESLCIKGCVYRLSHDCQLDVDRGKQVFIMLSEDLLLGTSQYLETGHYLSPGGGRRILEGIT